MAPSLVVSVAPAKKPGHFVLKLIHPNSKTVVYEGLIRAKSVNAAIAKGRDVKKNGFSNVRTVYTEIKHIARPKRGRVKLNTQKD
jgi:hypothetical protein